MSGITDKAVVALSAEQLSAVLYAVEHGIEVAEADGNDEDLADLTSARDRFNAAAATLAAYEAAR